MSVLLAFKGTVLVADAIAFAIQEFVDEAVFNRFFASLTNPPIRRTRRAMTSWAKELDQSSLRGQDVVRTIQSALVIANEALVSKEPMLLVQVRYN
jgi:hypothetical protein